jgi:hypothetical protein
LRFTFRASFLVPPLAALTLRLAFLPRPMTGSFTETMILLVPTPPGERPEERFDSSPLPGQMCFKPWACREGRFGDRRAEEPPDSAISPASHRPGRPAAGWLLLLVTAQPAKGHDRRYSGQRPTGLTPLTASARRSPGAVRHPC